MKAIKNEISIGPKPGPVENTDDFKNQLNEQQYEAVTTDGYALVLAGAGTGKTRVLTYRVAHLIKNGVDPRSILLLTFTKKAATEMLDRVAAITKDNSGRRVSGGTFHSFANYILRANASILGLQLNFSILDNADSEDVIDKIRSDLGYSKSKSLFPRKARLFEIISSARNKITTIKEIIKNEYKGLVKLIPDIEKISVEYKKFKKENALMDYDDLMEVTVESFRKNREFRKYIAHKYKYVLVDEFQDTNALQLDMVTWIADEGYENLMVVGDDMQSIYSFRGARYENISQFTEMFKDCKIIKLEQNYRSQPDILDFTNETLKQAPATFRKQLWSDKPAASKPKVSSFIDAEEEAEYVVDEMFRLRENNVPLNQIAVLVRASWNSNYVQIELEKRSIPYVVVGGVKFTERKHVKDIVAYMKIAHNPQDKVAWHRVLKLLPGVGPKTADKVISRLTDGGKVKLDLFNQLPDNKEVYKLCKVLSEISADEVPLPDKIETIKKHYYPIIEVVDEDAEIRMLDIEMIHENIGKYETLEKFLSDFALNPPSKKMAKQITPLVDETEEKPVTISTIHSAKGLEWHTVFVAHALDGIIPSVKAVTEEETEEERRLFYVACTRAKQNLYITRPAFLSNYGAFLNEPSRFISEIPDNLYDTLINKIGVDGE